jgi:type II secretory pathway component PulF
MGAMLAALLGSNAMAITLEQAQAQLNLVQSQQTGVVAVAKESLNILTEAGMSVDQAMSVLTDAMDNNFKPNELSQITAEMKQQLNEGIHSEFVAKTANSAISGDLSSSQTINAMNDFQGKVQQGMPAEQAFTSVNSQITDSTMASGSSTVKNSETAITNSTTGASENIDADVANSVGAGAGAFA